MRNIMVNHIFEKFLNEKTASFDSYMAEFFGEGTHPDMWRYLYGPLSEFSNNAGKRHRPLICMLACRAVGGDDQMARAAGAAIEHFHTAALIHDDIADESQLRRGKPCLHHQIGEGLAINAGDLALSLVTGTVLVDDSLSDAVKLRVLKELVDMTTRTIEGQALDIGWARDEYLTMAAHKTAFYSGGVPLAVGAIIGGGSEEQIETLRAYGMSTGLAFQIQDDLLNLVGTEEATRKDFRGDITEGKRTLVVVHALEHAQGNAHDELIDILSSKETDPESLERAVQIMREAGSIDFARSYAIKLAHDHQHDVEAVLPATPMRKLLVSMGDFFVSRLS